MSNNSLFMWILVLWVMLKIDLVLIAARVSQPLGGFTLLERIAVTFLYMGFSVVIFWLATRGR